MTIVFSLLVAVIGLLFYGFSTNAKVQEIGRIMFFCGLLVFTSEFGPGLKTFLK